MKYISGSSCKAILLLLTLALSGPVWGQDSGKESRKEPGQPASRDTLRTFGPRFGIDLVRLLYILADPSEIGAEVSADFEIYRNIYPVFELGYNSMDDSPGPHNYSSSGSYGRLGIDYNILPMRDRSLHHSITVGFRYGMSVFTHSVENAVVPDGYWGDYISEPYENNLTGHWMELVGALKTEVFPNFFLGFSLRYKILLNPDMDPLLVPELIPGYGKTGEDRIFGFTYSVFYKIPLIKK